MNQLTMADMKKYEETWESTFSARKTRRVVISYLSPSTPCSCSCSCSRPLDVSKSKPYPGALSLNFAPELPYVCFLSLQNLSCALSSNVCLALILLQRLADQNISTFFRTEISAGDTKVAGVHEPQRAIATSSSSSGGGVGRFFE